ncbi:ribonuclease H-like domain, reverse transcriptase, RNA-dependent DNA polymerase [Tanacetum coccineum]
MVTSQVSSQMGNPTKLTVDEGVVGGVSVGFGFSKLNRLAAEPFVLRVGIFSDASIQPPHNDSGHGEYGRVSDCVRNDVVTIGKVSQTWRAHTNNAGHEVAAAQLARAIHEQGVSRGALYRASPQLCENFEHNVAAQVSILIGCNCFVVAETSVCFANRAWWNNIEREAQVTGLSDMRLGTMDRRMKSQRDNLWRLNLLEKIVLAVAATHSGGCNCDSILSLASIKLNQSYQAAEMAPSRYMWVYFLKSKDEAFETFKEFKLKVENEVGKKIRSFRTDRGGEFTSREFTRYYNENDIVRQLTTPYSPQQNGIVERRNRHGVYVLNRVPIKALKDSTPYEALKVSYIKTQLIQEPEPKQIRITPNPDQIKDRPTFVSTDMIVSRDVKFKEDEGWDWKEVQSDELLLLEEEPRNYKEAAQDKKWIEAMQKEIDSINKNQTWKLAILPDNQKAIRLKWHGIDYDEVFAPVVRMGTVRLILALSAYHGWEVHHLDVKSAFLHGELKEEVYVTQPQGFKKPRNENKVYRLVKALYGLKQAPRAWNMKLDQTLKSLDFKKCTLEQAIYTKISKDSMLLVGVYVDDLIVTGSSKEDLQKFKSQMEEKFEMSDLGLLAYYLGIEVTQTEGGISIKQTGYANKILKEARMVDCNETKIPMDPGTKLIKQKEEN